MTTTSHSVALVIGATGGVGGAVTRVLASRGWRIKALNRDPLRAAKEHPIEGVEWVQGDSMNPDSVVAAAAGATLIVHAANPPGYKDWDKLIGPMMESSIAAAKATGARILLPGNVYNFDPSQTPIVAETTKEYPVSRKGLIRLAMEQKLMQSGVRALVVRAGDFYGPGVTANGWFGQMVKPGQPVRSVAYPGVRNVGHSWAYLPDLAETMVQLVEREAELDRYATFNFGGTWCERGEDMPRAILRVAGRSQAAIRGFPWPFLILASPFVPLFREILEMRYLWKTPLRLDNAKLVAFLGHEPRTPLDQAIALSLETLGCTATPRSSAPALVTSAEVA